jgi:hypothetical protein
MNSSTRVDSVWRIPRGRVVLRRGSGRDDEHYDLVSVLYHALQGGETSQQYIDDARKAHDAELARFFEQVQVEDRNRAESAKRLLIERLQVPVP